VVQYVGRICCFSFLAVIYFKTFSLWIHLQEYLFIFYTHECVSNMCMLSFVHNIFFGQLLVLIALCDFSAIAQLFFIFIRTFHLFQISKQFLLHTHVFRCTFLVAVSFPKKCERERCLRSSISVVVSLFHFCVLINKFKAFGKLFMSI